VRLLQVQPPGFSADPRGELTGVMWYRVLRPVIPCCPRYGRVTVAKDLSTPGVGLLSVSLGQKSGNFGPNHEVS
jgi:hypothetical protein